MGFQQALSGLNAASTSLSAIGNNVANSGTVGFKSAAAQFADMYASSMQGGGTSPVGIGSTVAAVAQSFTQGNLTTTNNPLDIAVNGGGMFRMSNGGTITYSRNGQFTLDKDGYIVNSGGLQLTGYAADSITAAIVPGYIVPLQVNNNAIPPVATTLAQVQVNVDSRALEPTSMSAGKTTGSAVPGLTVTAANNTFQIQVDGGPVKLVTVPAQTYSDITLLVTATQDAVDAALASFPATTATATVSLDANNHLQVTSGSVGSLGSQGKGSSVAVSADPANVAPLTAANSGFVNFFGAAPTATVLHGYATGSTTPAGTVAVPVPLTVVAGTDDQFNIAVDGMLAPVTVTLTPGTYNDPAALAAQLTTDINAALGSQGAVDVTADTTGAMVVTTRGSAINSESLPSQVTLSAYAGPPANGGYASLFGAPTAVAGEDMDNFKTSDINSYTASTAQTVYDSLGNPHTLALYYVKTSQPTQWQFYTALDGGTPTKATNLTFSSSGVLMSPAPGAALTQTFAVDTGAINPLVFDLSLTGTTQYGIPFGTNSLTQDGYTSGKLSGMSVSADGVVQGRYSNGKSRNMGQLVLANFNNPNGLQSLGNNQWAETSTSGSPIPGAPGTGNLGLVQSGAVEESNVDMTAELVNMITAQRAYQANAQTIKTMDQIMQTLVNLR